MDSIFEGIVKDENDHTRLLANLAERHPIIKAHLLERFSNGKVSNSNYLNLAIDTQWIHTDENLTRMIPDIRIKGNGFTCLLEAKIQNSLTLNSTQRSLYHSCLEGDDEKYFCVLVRSIAKYEHEFPSMREFAAEKGIHLHALSWADLLSSLEKFVEQLNDEIASEVVSFLKRRFEVVTWSEEERKKIEEEWSVESFLAIRKLEKVIEQTKAVAEAKGYKTEGEYSAPESHGFYIMSNRKYSIWIGTWSEAKVPVSLAISPKDSAIEAAAIQDMGESSIVSKDKKWKIYPLHVNLFDPEKQWLGIEQSFPNLLKLVAED
jgi:hypothetical protein